MTEYLAGIVESGQEAQQLATDFVFTEGPLWHPDGYWLFVDLRREPPVIHRMSPAGGTPEIIREPSGGTNGMTFDLQGRLLMCEGDNRGLPGWSTTAALRCWPTGGRQATAPAQRHYLRSDGSIYFTNPSGRVPPEEQEIEFAGRSSASCPMGRLPPRLPILTIPTGLRSRRTSRCCTCRTPARWGNGPTSIGTARSSRTSTSGPTTWRPTVR